MVNNLTNNELFDIAEIAKFTPEEQQAYQNSFKTHKFLHTETEKHPHYVRMYLK